MYSGCQSEVVIKIASGLDSLLQNEVSVKTLALVRPQLRLKKVLLFGASLLAGHVVDFLMHINALEFRVRNRSSSVSITTHPVVSWSKRSGRASVQMLHSFSTVMLNWRQRSSPRP